MAFSQVKRKFGVVSAIPLPSEKELSEFYAETYFQDSVTTTYQQDYSDRELAHKKLLAKQVVHSVTPFTKSGKECKLLDVGCGEGFILNAAHLAGMHVSGIDFSQYGLEKFHPSLLGNFLQGDAYSLLGQLVEEGTKFDVCILQNILEHVRDPAALLKTVSQLLDDDGVCAITVPNDFSKIQKQAEREGHIDREYWFSPPDHLHYFSTENISSFIQDHGFEMLDFFGSFPIEIFAYHPGSNYTKGDALAGKHAHQARVSLDLLAAEGGMENFHGLCRSLAKCSLSRTVTVVIKPAGTS